MELWHVILIVGVLYLVSECGRQVYEKFINKENFRNQQQTEALLAQSQNFLESPMNMNPLLRNYFPAASHTRGNMIPECMCEDRDNCPTSCGLNRVPEPLISMTASNLSGNTSYDALSQLEYSMV
jgi:Tfp pilus assembly protein PilE